MQIQGEVIDVDVAGDVADLFVTWRDRKRKQSLAEQSTTLLFYNRYVDNIDILVTTSFVM